MRKNKLLLIIAVTTIGIGLTAALTAAVVVYAGIYDISATRQHIQLTHSLMETAMRQSVRRQARNIDEPPLTDPQMALRGAASYHSNCVQCHGAPGVAQSAIGLSMQPLPGPLVDAREHWRPRELYWVVRHGIKMTGMPAWQYRLPDEQLWELVAFMQKLPQLDATQYAQWTQSTTAPAGGQRNAAAQARPAPDFSPDVERGRQALHQYACNACHSIPGITGSDVYVGPPLKGIGNRTLIAGTLANTPQNLARWLTHTQEVKPGTAMPQLGVSPEDAQDMAAFLATLQ
ncbi:c-type cytochrome [Comamonas endophytica]|uniref:C-type cytochrome n=1 Tax=Comamonas endophytica TaxID=2949090 RepID=A0ABY6GB55_9BURK|nr:MULTISPECIES: c-type cytochrome [unclassified Acidovorax]MCD2512173.1 c-type cytochrome [Acidovorax sp. D4N7]UYG51945.1 c-type cytochrome [Acidovorax sp. 5MLIR]